MPHSPAIPALDLEIARKYINFLATNALHDNMETRLQFCAEAGIHIKLLLANPHIAAIAAIYRDHSTLERLLDMSLRDYLKYHFHYVHLGFRFGSEELQQTWLGHRLVKSPFDCWAYQEIICRTRPDVVIELGVMFGGSSIFFAHLFDLMGHGEVIGIDVDMSKVEHQGHRRVHYIKGSSISEETLTEVRNRVKGKKAMVIADSDHEKSHVLQELHLYSEFIPVGGYMVAEDSLNDVMGYHPVPNEGPLPAAHLFLQENSNFAADLRLAEKYILTISPYGFLKRVK